MSRIFLATNPVNFGAPSQVKTLRKIWLDVLAPQVSGADVLTAAVLVDGVSQFSITLNAASRKRVWLVVSPYARGYNFALQFTVSPNTAPVTVYDHSFNHPEDCVARNHVSMQGEGAT